MALKYDINLKPVHPFLSYCYLNAWRENQEKYFNLIFILMENRKVEKLQYQGIIDIPDIYQFNFFLKQKD